MAKVTSKLQVTIPKVLAKKYRIEPGGEVEWSASGDAIRLTPGQALPKPTLDHRLGLFDQATARQREREKGEREKGERKRPPSTETHERGWTREDLYDRGSTR